MPQSQKTPSRRKLLGETLKEANLVSANQIDTALTEQAQNPDKKIGEILVSKGWIKQETVDFFAEQWEDLLTSQSLASEKKLGDYLCQAGLLEETQVRLLIEEQKQGSLWIRLGALATLKGLLKQSTVDFFLDHLFPEQSRASSFVKATTKR